MGHTQVEVAKEIGISQAQVSRLEKNTIDKIKGSDNKYQWNNSGILLAKECRCYFILSTN